MRDIVNFKRSILRKMNAQTKKILTLVGVGVGAVLAYRFITKENSESKSNDSGESKKSHSSFTGGRISKTLGIEDNGRVRLADGGETCRCSDGTIYQCRRPGCCATYCSHLGGLDSEVQISNPVSGGYTNRSVPRRSFARRAR